MQQRGSGSGSPPYQQNPLEPKLAAGPASGYPQQLQQFNQPIPLNGLLASAIMPIPQPMTLNPEYEQLRMNMPMEDVRMQPSEEELAEI